VVLVRSPKREARTVVPPDDASPSPLTYDPSPDRSRRVVAPTGGPAASSGSRAKAPSPGTIRSVAREVTQPTPAVIEARRRDPDPLQPAMSWRVLKRRGGGSRAASSHGGPADPDVRNATTIGQKLFLSFGGFLWSDPIRPRSSRSIATSLDQSGFSGVSCGRAAGVDRGPDEDLHEQPVDAADRGGRRRSPPPAPDPNRGAIRCRSWTAPDAGVTRPPTRQAKSSRSYLDSADPGIDRDRPRREIPARHARGGPPRGLILRSRRDPPAAFGLPT